MKKESVKSALGGVLKCPLPPLRKVFAPGAGTPPPMLAGRGEILSRIHTDFITPLLGGQAPRHALLFHGPRGSGKTCLMEAVRKRGLENSPNLQVIRIRNSMLDSPKTLAEEIFAESGQVIKTTTNLGGGAGSLARVEHGWETDRRFGLNVMKAIKTASSGVPLLLLFDEMHTVRDKAKQDSMQDFLQCIQSLASEGVPVGLIMAGTPDAYGNLKKVDASFVERMIGHVGGFDGNWPISTIDVIASEQAIAQPFADLGRALHPEVLGGVHEQTAGYPYFIQMYGDALVNAALRICPDERVVPVECAYEAFSEFTQRKDGFYGERWSEMRNAGVLEAAIKLIAGIRKHEGSISSDDALVACAEGLAARNETQSPAGFESVADWVSDSSGAMNQILHLGLAWGDRGATSDVFGLSIPSLADHVIRKAAEGPVPHLRRLAVASRTDTTQEARSLERAGSLELGLVRQLLGAHFQQVHGDMPGVA